MKKYMIYNKPGDYNSLGLQFNIDPLIAKLMINRDVAESDFNNYLKPDITTLNDAHLLTDMDKAVALIQAVVADGVKVRIIGDYDIDGVNATYILMVALRQIGAIVDYAIPNRIEDGYGINPQIVSKAIDDGVGCIITCDNGVSAMEAFELASEAGITTIITDHHTLVSETVDGCLVDVLPEADAIINPHRRGDNYPFADICGAYVAYKLVECLYEAYDIELDKLHQLIPFAAFATVGDVMELVGENRTLVKYGLEAMNKASNLGLRALIEATQVKKPITSYALGFVLGPCINASGRLDTARLAVELLLAEDNARAHQLAEQLVELNEERKQMTQLATVRACELAEKDYSHDKILVIYLPDVHESICGIVAGRLREATYKPSIVLTQGESAIKGSARSIDSYNMYQGLAEFRDMYEAFGGHPMAAGLTLRGDLDAVDLLRKRLNQACNLTEEDLVSKEMIDVAMPLSYISIPLIEQLGLLEPFGNGNKKPCFAYKGVDVISASYIGRNTRYFKFKLSTDIGPMDGLCFMDHELVEKKIKSKYGEDAFFNMMNRRSNPVKLDIIYYPQINEYNGYKSIQVVINDIL